MASATEGVPLPPGFEEYNENEKVSDEELAAFEAFMRQPLDKGTSGSSQTGGGKEWPSHERAAASSRSRLVGEEEAKVEIRAPHDDDAGAVENLLSRDIKFEDLNLSEDLLRGIYEIGFVTPSKIQAAALPLIARQKDGSLGRSILAQAQNGSGKTATFALALLSSLNIQNYTPQALIVCPTRELAMQNEAVVSQLGQFLPVSCTLVLPSETSRVPKHPQTHVLVGTPGKVGGLITKRVLDVSQIRIFVLDEADLMLDQANAMGPQVTQIRKALPQDLQVLFFSATFPDEVRRFANNLVPRAFSIEVKKTELTLSTVAQMYSWCNDNNEKFKKLQALYASMNVGQSVIFVNQRKRAFQLAQWMRDAGFAVSLICGTQQANDWNERMDPALRDQVMGEFRSGVTKVLIATDVLARGIDVPQVTLVVNYELPVQHEVGGTNMETYLHRVGRTGRFGLKGVAVNLVTGKEWYMIDEIKRFFECEITEMKDDFEELEERVRQLR